jgi:hypothetical protein
MSAGIDLANQRRIDDFGYGSIEGNAALMQYNDAR